MPQHQRCFPAFTQGPCHAGDILVVTNGSSVPKCKKNECKNENEVLFNNKCYKLNEEEGCKRYSKLIGRKVLLVVDPTTITLSCRDEDDYFKCANDCCKGKTLLNIN